MLSFSEDQVRRLARVDDVIRAIGVAFTRDFSSTLRMPARTSLQLDNALLLIMPAYDSALGAAGVKLVSVSKKSGVQAVYELLDPTTGIPVARMQANYLTDLRTAATSAFATDLLARQDVHTLGVFGSGRQAEAHFAALPAVRRFERFLVCGSGRTDLRGFCETMKVRHGIRVEPATAEDCARSSDVLCTCTSAGEPLFLGDWLRPGTHLNLVGAFQPHTREVDDMAVKRSRVFVDTYEGAMAEAGDLLIPIQNGTVDRSHVIADLHELASGKRSGRNHPDDITLFKSLGCALEDLVTAKLVYDRNQS